MLIKYIRNMQNASLPADTGRKLNARKTFRRRPIRLLNVLCAFHLRPVTTGLAFAFSTRNSSLGQLCTLHIQGL